MLGIALALPALFVGFQLDDFTHRAIMLRGQGIEKRPLDVFASLTGDPALNGRLMDYGFLPWWTVPSLRFSFCRVLSAASMWMDYRLWPDSPVLMHLHSLAWLAAAIGAAAVLYRRVLGPGWVAGLAAVLYAVDDGHAGPAAWIANRNALLATFLGLLCLICHDRWRREGWRAGAFWSAVCLALGLLSGEMALGALAYLASYALFLEDAPVRKRLVSLLPAASTLVGWAAYYRMAGFGTHGSGLYVDPIDSPREFLSALLHRAPVLLLGQWTPIPAELGGLLPKEGARVLEIVAIGAVALLASAFFPPLKRDRRVRFFGLGMILSLVPIVATFPANRLLLFVGIGAMGLVAQFLGGAAPAGRWAAALRIFLVVTHLVLAPLSTPLAAYSVKSVGEASFRAAASIPGDLALARQELVIVNSPDYLFFVSYLPELRRFGGQPSPRRALGLVAGPVPLEVSREDERTLRVRLYGGLYEGVLGHLFRSEREPLRAGDVVELAGLSVRVEALTADAQPRELTFRFSAPLEDPSFRWVRWQGDVYTPFEPPAAGKSVLLPAPRGPFDVFRRVRTSSNRPGTPP